MLYCMFCYKKFKIEDILFPNSHWTFEHCTNVISHSLFQSPDTHLMWSLDHKSTLKFLKQSDEKIISLKQFPTKQIYNMGDQLEKWIPFYFHVYAQDYGIVSSMGTLSLYHRFTDSIVILLSERMLTDLWPNSLF